MFHASHWYTIRIFINKVDNLGQLEECRQLSADTMLNAFLHFDDAPFIPKEEKISTDEFSLSTQTSDKMPFVLWDP